MNDKRILSRRILHLDEQVDKVATVPHRLFDRAARSFGVGGALSHNFEETHFENDGCRRIRFAMSASSDPNVIVFEYIIIEKFEHFLQEPIEPEDFVILDIMEDGPEGKPQTRIAEGFEHLDRINHDRDRRYYFSAFPAFLPAGLTDSLRGCEKHDTPALLNELMSFLGLDSSHARQ